MGRWWRGVLQGVSSCALLIACERDPRLAAESPPQAVASAPEPRAVEIAERAAADTTPKKRAKKKPRRVTKPQPQTPAADVVADPGAVDPFEAEPRSCCKYCSKGKACGNSCIAAAKTCHKGVGCACDL